MGVRKTWPAVTPLTAVPQEHNQPRDESRAVSPLLMAGAARLGEDDMVGAGERVSARERGRLGLSELNASWTNYFDM